MNNNKAKNYALFSVIYLSVLAIYNLIIFLIFKEFNNVFWISYGFMTAAFLANVAVVLIASHKSDVEAAFFGIPLLSFSIFHVCAELFASLILMIARFHVSVQLAVTVQVIMLLILLIFGSLAIFSRDTVQQISDNVKTNVANIKALAVEVQLLESDCLDTELKAELHKVAEAIRYSDPMTNDTVAPLDEMIKGKVAELKYQCQNDDKNGALETCYKLEAYIRERNSKLLVSK